MPSAPVRLVALIDETVLRRQVGGSEVMVDQLRFLQETARRSNVDIHAIPLGADWHPALEGPFQLVEFVDRPPVVHIENRRSGQFFHEPNDVGAYLQAVAWVREVAMSVDESADLIAKIIDEMETP